VRLARSIADALAIVGAELKNCDVTVEVDVQPTDLSVLADAAAMDGLLINLVRNAVDAMQNAPQRMLRIDARAQDGRAILTVNDTGPGIRADILPRLFEPFVTSKSAGAGLGLGLVISAESVRAMGGVLRAINREGGGACFTVDLPIAMGQE
jgi:two-component system C4-dicarboxylate transport sensor histidine kinase DctB